MRISANVCDYARSIAEDCRIDSACAFISDKTAGAAQIYVLGNYGVSDEVLDQYREHRICDRDPFTDTQAIERAAPEAGDGSWFLGADHPQVQRCGERAEDYWKFVSQRDIEVVGAASMPLQSRLYLTVGIHRSRQRRYRSGVPIERLAHRITIMQNRIATDLLSMMLGGGRGYQSLIDVFRPAAQAESAALGELSSRETEIARLVCQGKQNKEIAWLAKLSEYTVENHLRRIYQKLGIHNRAALVAKVGGVLA